MSMHNLLLPTTHDATAAAVVKHRAEGRWTDASVELERWVANCRKQTPTFVMPAGSSGVGSQSTQKGLGIGVVAMSSKFAARGRAGRAPAPTEDDGSAAEFLRQRVPRLRLLVERESKEGTEQLGFVAQVRKTNAVGKVQSRLIVVTDSAVYNTDSDCRKVKRRIPLLAIGMVTASEHTGQFILHVPSEYDYLYSAPTRGYSILDDAVPPGTALDGIIAALQRAYNTHVARAPGLLPAGAQMQLAVRTFSDAGPLAALVKKKVGSLGSLGGRDSMGSRDSMGDGSSTGTGYSSGRSPRGAYEEEEDDD